LEGAVWANDTIYVSQLRDWGDPAPGRILRLEGTSLVEVVSDANAGSNGLALRADGKLIVASQGKHALLVFDPANPSVAPETLVTGYMSKGFNSPNDLALRADGNMYLTDPGWNCGNDCPQGSPNTATNNRVYRITPTGTVEAIDPPHDKPNGIALSPDGNTLYVAGDNAGIVKYALAADGAIGAQSPFASVQGVDGMTIDCAGNLYASVNGQNRIDVFKPDGSPVAGSITTTGTSVTNVAFGGAEHKTLYITVNTADGTGALHSVELDIPGYPY
jgi:gluconolactonase